MAGKRKTTVGAEAPVAKAPEDMRVIFHEKFTWRPAAMKGRWSRVYNPRPVTVLVPRACGEEASAAGKATEATVEPAPGADDDR